VVCAKRKRRFIGCFIQLAGIVDEKRFGISPRSTANARFVNGNVFKNRKSV